ncbi:ATP-dependent nuclease [Chryseobacterium polytrichastri]|uniref:AAA domain-containing protein, putative AbiEii toxin, Type IV TA system n=1 Tax=Chryseobacterium polytrichastri TaxID=1302687 RepID=A0A1M6Z1C3_9FLAO|nr:ATP-binding protein [Chryseobacterium polytrichastri]SHL24344.1 AAA domain-containing protein, putative AbiEii toxin, Type IV TA system [Chryseobacterium polytrichastri]
MGQTLSLKMVRFSGYKSIENVSIEFKKGLNIIIGKNAAGKTNFLNFLNKSLKFDFKGLNNFESQIVFEGDKKITIDSKRSTDIKDFFKANDFNASTESKLRIGRKVVKVENPYSDLSEYEIFYNSTFICHGVPKDLPIINNPLTFKFIKDKISDDLTNIYRSDSTTYFVKNIILQILFADINFGDITELAVENSLKEKFEKLSLFNEILRKYSPISEIRISDNFNVFIADDSKEITISNVFLEFKIGKQWLPFSSLSDGTKRLFYIISEIYDVDNEDLSKFGITHSTYLVFDRNKVNRLILLEEPELGVHPHQFHKLMEFLKLQSETKQIIITTHSPQALDFLESNEFNRIILAYVDIDSSLTKLRHLDEKELKKAKEYVKENFLSDYWLYSDLEK